MLVSILVPIYNVEEHIIKCARSLFEQSYDNCEFIFVDDCSKDNSVQRLTRILDDEYANIRHRVKIVRHSRNRGVAEARNTAMDSASGDFLLFVDSDDWCAPTLVARLVREQRIDNADLVSSDYYSMSNNKKKMVSTHWIGGREGSLMVVLAQSFALPNRVWSLLIRSSLIHRNGIRFEGSINYGEDSLFLVRLLYYSREISHVSAPLYYYRADSAGSYSNNITRTSRRNYIRSQFMIYDFLKEQDATIRYADSLVVGQMNLRRWMLVKSKSRSLLGYIYRSWCFVVNQLWTIRCWLLAN